MMCYGRMHYLFLTLFNDLLSLNIRFGIITQQLMKNILFCFVPGEEKPYIEISYIVQDFEQLT